MMGSQTPGPTDFVLISDHSWVKVHGSQRERGEG